ncbi:unnamed protein product [Protopolystoma xenopodis]|uniref:Uncharacterized protein n=1 Tax=Protopolystoma xenopodis TaxID=117903 RepID=A0A3S5BVK2_9PLAT|nr:unnamed protein product [Protopolystoma xenopodis]
MKAAGNALLSPSRLLAPVQVPSFLCDLAQNAVGQGLVKRFDQTAYCHTPLVSVIVTADLVPKVEQVTLPQLRPLIALEK